MMIQKKIRSSSEMQPIDLKLVLDLYSDVDEVRIVPFTDLSSSIVLLMPY